MKKKNNSGLVFTIILVVAIFAAYFFLSSESPIFTVEQKNVDGDVIGVQSVFKAKSLELSQSVLENTLLDKIILQAAQPVEENYDTFASFKIVLENPFSTSADLLNIKTYKNNEVIDNKDIFQVNLPPSGSYLFKTDAYDLAGLDGQQNVIRIDALFKSAEGVTKTISYEYKYLSVTSCTSDNDCPDLNPVCDTVNGAKLSKDLDVHYCVRRCNNHNECVVGQLCLQGGYCGY